MIPIAIKSKGCIDRNSILSINSTRTQAPLCAGNISALNKSAIQSGAGTPNMSAPNAHVSSVPTQTHPRKQSAAARNTPPAAAHSMPSTAAHRTPSAAVRNTTPAAVSSAPARQKLPVFQKPVQKGQKITLTADGSVSGIWRACFGWNTAHPQCDADVSAFLLGSNGKVIGDSWFVFYGQTESPDKSCRFLTQQGTDREVITIDFQKLHADVKKIVFVLTINEAFEKRLHFGMMQDAYIRLMDHRGSECVSFQMSDYYSNVISMMIGEIYQYNGSWKFHAVGNGVAKDLAGLCALYGVEVSD